MQTYLNAIHKYGHLYDRETGKRILLKDDVELVVVIESRHNNLHTVDPKNDPDDEGNKPRLIEELKSEMDSEDFYQVRKLKDRDDYLYFVIKAGEKNEQGRRSYECCFRVKLLEESYMVWKGPSVVDGEFYSSDSRTRSCSCVVDKLEYGNTRYFEPVYGSSLSDVYTLTYEIYFARYGRSGPNVYKHLLLYVRQPGQPFMQIRRRILSASINFGKEK